MKVVCGWCDAVLRPDSNGDGRVSHGICPACSERMLETTRTPLNGMLDRLDFPVLAFGAGTMVVGANRSASEFLGKPVKELVRRRPGDVIECKYAATKGGCGGTRHCEGCTLRRSIVATHEDGEPRYGVLSDHVVGPPEHQRLVHLRFSTVRQDSLVILTVERT